MPDEDKNFGGSLILDFRIWWRHAKTIYYASKEVFRYITYFTVIQHFPRINIDQIHFWQNHGEKALISLQNRFFFGRQNNFSLYIFF